jgi:Ca2+-transporting ATPase
MQYQGLTSTEAAKKLEKSGLNLIREPVQVRKIIILLNQFNSPLIYVLLIAALVSLLLNKATDSLFIMVVVLINAALGYAQESKAQNLLHALKSRVSHTVKVIRDGERKLVETKFIVPGDLVVIEPGLRIPADGFLLVANNISVDESLLTGESEPSHKYAKEGSTPVPENLIFMGTAVAQGIGIAQITETANRTEYGKIASSLDQNFDPPTPIKMELKRISKFLVIITLVTMAVVIVLGFLHGLPLEEIFLTSVALGVSTIPEGLLISLTVTLALGMNRIMQHKAIIRNLPAAETLGSVDVLCIDKTGTLTLGKMQVVSEELSDREAAYRALAICNNDSNFIDIALLNYLKEQKHGDFAGEIQLERKLFLPFMSQAKFTAASDGTNIYAVGAPEVILNFCDEPHKNLLLAKVSERAADGFRMLAVAVKKSAAVADLKPNLKQMQFLGMLALKDPVRESAEKALERILHAGVAVKVITGDLQETALSVLRTIHFNINENEIVSGDQLKSITTEKELDLVTQRTKLFYRTSPDQKLKIVSSLQRQGYRVGMMGDGVNDSPAINKAEIGISVDTGTDLSKEVADLVLLETDFGTIVNAIIEGRNIFGNLRKLMVYLFADSLSETILILLSLLFGLPLPLLPLQLLWINLIEDGLPSLALSFEPSSANVLRHKPEHYQRSAFDLKLIGSIVIISVFIDTIYFLLYSYMLANNYQQDAARTLMFAGLSFSSLLFIFSAKTADSNIWREPIFNNRVLNISLLIGLFMLAAAIYFPPLQHILGTVSLNSTEVGIVLVLAFTDVILTELVKLIARKVKI